MSSCETRVEVERTSVSMRASTDLATPLGEIGIVGTAAAIANAVFHATGRRVRDLPMTPDRLLATVPVVV